MTKETITRRAEFFDRWIEALKSGKYKQGYGQLRAKNKYCCLGVACEVFNGMCADGVGGLTKKDKLKKVKATNKVDYTYDGDLLGVPPTMEAKLGVKLEGYEVKTTRSETAKYSGYAYRDVQAEETALAELNDSENFDFNAIATVIKRNKKAFYTEE